ncbi:MAG: lytic murein transglycosylase [Desulfobacteraceae bacterium]|jgi:membrane-bound lytic murein transglycosylase B
MKIKIHLSKINKGVKSWCLIILLSLSGSGVLWAADGVPNHYFKPLKQRLVEEGFDAGLIDKIYNNPAVSFEVKGVSLYFVHNEAKLNYDQFSSPKMVEKARSYMSNHAQALDSARRKFGVDGEVITAIMLVETKLGTYVGKNSILSTLSTMSVLKDSGPREIVWKALPESRRYARNVYDKKADGKSNWAYKELKAFLTYTQKHKVDPVSTVGSYAGALGIAQFMPSNILVYGADGNGDGKIDLFQHADAIFSIAKYLKHYGWRPGISSTDAAKVVYHYNHSKYYVNTILKIATLLKQS